MVRAAHRRRWELGSEAVEAEYGTDTLRVIPAVERIMSLLASDTGGVVLAVEKQLRLARMDSRVRTGWDSWLCGLVRCLPISDRMMDWVLGALVALPTPAVVPLGAVAAAQ